MVQRGVREGLTTGDGVKDRSGTDGAAGEPRRRLDLLAALEFSRLHHALSKKDGNGKGGSSPADERTRQAIARALKENWGLRDVKHYVDKAISEVSARGAKKARGRPATPFKKTSQQLVVYYDRLEALSIPQWQSLRKALEELLRKLARRPIGHR